MFGGAAYGQPPFAASSIVEPAAVFDAFALQEQAGLDSMSWDVTGFAGLLFTISETGDDVWSDPELGNISSLAKDLIEQAIADTWSDGGLTVDIKVNFGLAEDGTDTAIGSIISYVIVTMDMTDLSNQDGFSATSNSVTGLDTILVENNVDQLSNFGLKSISELDLVAVESGVDTATFAMGTTSTVSVTIALEGTGTDSFVMATTIVPGVGAGIVETDIDTFSTDLDVAAETTMLIVEDSTGSFVFDVGSISEISVGLAETGTDALDIIVEAHRGKFLVDLVETGLDTFEADTEVSITTNQNIPETEIDQMSGAASSVAMADWEIQEENIGEHTRDQLTAVYDALPTFNMDLTSEYGPDSFNLSVGFRTTTTNVMLTEEPDLDSTDWYVGTLSTGDHSLVETSSLDTASVDVGSVTGILQVLRETGTPTDGMIMFVSGRTEVEGAIQENTDLDVITSGLAVSVQAEATIVEPELDEMVIQVGIPRDILTVELIESGKLDRFQGRIVQDRDPSDVPARVTGCPVETKSVNGGPHTEAMIGQPVDISTLTGHPHESHLTGKPLENGNESMAESQNITGFHKGEALRIILNAKNPDKTTLTSPASNTITCVISTTARGPSLISVDSTPEVQLTDTPNAQWTIIIPASDLSDMVGGQEYHYNIWSQVDGEDPLLQVKGTIALQEAVPIP